MCRLCVAAVLVSVRHGHALVGYTSLFANVTDYEPESGTAGVSVGLTDLFAFGILPNITHEPGIYRTVNSTTIHEQPNAAAKPPAYHKWVSIEFPVVNGNSL